jgi:hypothetical protein
MIGSELDSSSPTRDGTVDVFDISHVVKPQTKQVLIPSRRDVRA